MEPSAPTTKTNKQAKQLFIVLPIIVLLCILAAAVVKLKTGTLHNNPTKVATSTPTPTPPNSSLYSFAATIVNVSGNTLTVKTLMGDPTKPPQESAPKEVNVTVNISPDTVFFSPDSSQKFTQQDLKPNLRIVVDSNITPNSPLDKFSASKISLPYSQAAQPQPPVATQSGKAP